MKQTVTEAIKGAEKKFESYYLDYFNNFLTYGGYADYYWLEDDEAAKRIDLGRVIHNHRTAPHETTTQTERTAR